MKTKPKTSANGFTILELGIALIFGLVLLTFLSMPVVGVIRTNQTIHALKQYCNMDVGFWEVAINGDQLTKICTAQNRKVEVELTNQ